MKFKDLQLDRFQEEAFRHIDAEHSLIVSAPTGAGKTVIAEYAVEHSLEREKGVIYTAPVKALSSQKYRDFSADYGDKVGILTGDVVPHLRCSAIVGPANNQLATAAVADLLHRRGIVWVPDYVVSAGGVINALTLELHHETPDEARERVEAIEHTVAHLLDTAEHRQMTPAQAATELARLRLDGPPSTPRHASA